MKLNLRKMMAVLVVAVVTFGASAQNLYIFGSFNGWKPEESIEMWNDNGVYTIEDIEFGAGGNFAVATVQSSDWGLVNANRYGFATDNAIATEGVEMPIVKGEGAMQVPSAGIYNIYVNLAAMTVLVKQTKEVVVELPAELYIVGYDNNWNPETPTVIPMTETEGVYSAKLKFVSNKFKFSEAKGTWDEFNAKAICIANDQEVGLDQPVELYKYSATDCITTVELDKEYEVEINLNDNTIRIKDASGVEGIEIDETVAAVYYNLQGVEVANPQNGLYIVKQGNKVSKQLIK